MPTARLRVSKSDSTPLTCPAYFHVRVVQRPSTPVFPTGNTGSIPVTDALCSCPCPIVVNTPFSQTGNTGSIPVMDTKSFTSVSYSGQYSRLSNGQHGFDSRHRYFTGRRCLVIEFAQFAAPTRASIPSRRLLARRLRSPCWAPRQLIPVCATVRFRRLRPWGRLPNRTMPASSPRAVGDPDHCGPSFSRAPCRRSPTRKTTGSTPVRSTPWACRRRYGTLLVRETPIEASTLGRAKKSSLVRRGASGEAMTVAPDARRSVRQRERTRGSIPSTATEMRHDVLWM